MDRDDQIRQAAFAHCKAFAHRFSGVVPWSVIEAGFHIEGEHVYLAGKAREIHRPRQMQRGVLSIKTSRPRKGRTARYDDSLGDDGYFSYAFQGDDPGSEVGDAGRALDFSFLSCLCGSEDRELTPGIRHKFLSCLCGSEVQKNPAMSKIYKVFLQTRRYLACISSKCKIL